MPSLADVVQQMGPSITYDERTRRFHDMEQNYRMVSTKGVAAGRPARADGRDSSGYVTQEAFNSFKSEIYLYISKVASFTREALVEMQKTMTGEQRDTESLRNDEQKAAEERRERRRELVRGALTRVSSGIRQATGMGPLGALFTGLFATLTGVLANTDIEKIRETFNSIGAVFDNIREFFNKLQEYSNIILAIGAALAAMVLANMLDRNKPRTPKPSSPNKPSPTPGSGSGSGSGPKPTTGGGAGAGAGAGGAGAGAAAGGKPVTAAPTAPSPPAPVAETTKSGKTRYRDPETGRFTKAPKSGAPTTTPPATSGQPEADRSAGKSNRLRLGRFLGALGPLIEVLTARGQLQSLSEQRDSGDITEEEYKNQVISILAGSAGAIVGGAVGGALGSLLGPVGAMLSGYAGAIGGARLGEILATTDLGRRIGSVIYDKFFAERETNQPATELATQLTELQRQSRQRVLDTDEMVNTTERAVNEGRITEAQARQINEIGSQQGTVRRAGDIEAVIEAISASGLEGANSRLVAGRERGTGRIIVLPPYYQESIRPGARQNQPAPAPSNPAGIQTRNSDNTLEDAQASAAFMNAAF